MINAVQDTVRHNMEKCVADRQRKEDDGYKCQQQSGIYKRAARKYWAREGERVINKESLWCKAFPLLKGREKWGKSDTQKSLRLDLPRQHVDTAGRRKAGNQNMLFHAKKGSKAVQQN